MACQPPCAGQARQRGVVNTLEAEIAAAADWLRSEAPAVKYGEISVKLILHRGAVVRTERTVSQTQLPNDGRGDEHRQ
jgi:hypothetical protein